MLTRLMNASAPAAWWSLPTARVAVVITAIVLMAALVIAGLQLTAQPRLRRRVSRELGVRIPRGCRIASAPVRRKIGSFLLEYPTWRHARSDRTRDDSSAGNRIERHWSVLDTEGWRIMCRDVFTLYDLVLAVREAGFPVAPSRHEVIKKRTLNEHLLTRHRNVTVEGLISTFSQNPSGLGVFCGDLFRALGYQAEVSRRSARSPLELHLHRNGRTAMVGYLCQERSRAVGQGVLRRMHEARTAEQSDALIVVTTSEFTPEAVEYARRARIELIDGDRLVAMARKAWGNVLRLGVTPSSWVSLTNEELRTGFPPDMMSGRG